MPTLDALPPGDVVMALKGTLDYYVWRGVPCVRSWPQWTLAHRSPAVQAAETAFASYTRRVNASAERVRQAAADAAAGQPWTWRDILTSAIYSRLNVP